MKKKVQPHGKTCACPTCEHAKEIRRRNARAADDVGIKLLGEKADRPLRSCMECKTPVYAGKAAPHRPDLPIWAWQYNPEKVDWGVEYASDGGAPALCPRCRRKVSA